MAKPQSENRRARRYPLEKPVKVRTSNGQNHELEAQARDVSSNGIYFYTDSEMHEGSEIEIVAMLPPEITQSESVWVCCHARVVRVEQESEGPRGIAAVIERYAVLPEA
jgi:hypothetical protein